MTWFSTHKKRKNASFCVEPARVLKILAIDKRFTSYSLYIGRKPGICNIYERLKAVKKLNKNEKGSLSYIGLPFCVRLSGNFLGVFFKIRGISLQTALGFLMIARGKKLL